MPWTSTLRSAFRLGGLAEESDTVDHDILMNRVSRKIRDKGILCLIGKHLRAGVVVNGRLNKTSKGVPQGGPPSPLLSNILLDDLDRELEKKGIGSPDTPMILSFS
jgi:RNA-directed DNA polymerase